ncbi:MAG: DNA-formamidopyrimidine glycosylase [Alicyclobacillus sp.]|nr:DNA-formamidopyrimidine glycosylase [Alicyclobacillus sp.]
MPELPEVENVRRSLVATVLGKTIDHVDVRLPRLIRTPDDSSRFALELAGRTIAGVDRRGKYLVLKVPPYTLVSHLRMEGQYRFVEAPAEATPEALHTHVVFHFSDGSALRYRDVRQFGTMDLVPENGPFPKGLASLGPEPFDEQLTGKVLYARIHPRSAPLKAVLLDQTTVAGLGNIYVDEALWAVGVHPAVAASRLTRAQADALLTAIRDVLDRAIAAGGSSVKTYQDGYGRHGGFQMELAVYGQEGKPCPRCGTDIQKTRVAGRGTHFCQVCQRPPRPRHLKSPGAAGKERVRT